MRHALAVVALASLVGCGSHEATRDRPRPAARDAGAVVSIDALACAPPDELVSTAGRFDCAVDADCVNTCEWGAISRAAAARLDDACDDGCANQVSAPPRCERNACVAYEDRGSGAVRRDWCTHKDGPAFVCRTPAVDAGAASTATCSPPKRPVSTAHRFDCAVDADCVDTCAWGAISVTAARALGEGCKDGCADKAGAPPRCEANRCVAYRRRAGAVVRDDDCTGRPAPDPLCVP